MKKRTIISSLTAIGTACTMSLSASASAGTAETKSINNANANVIDETVTATIPVNKDILLFNIEGFDIYAPNITYSYDITSANTTEDTKIITYAADDLKADGTPKEGAQHIITTVHSGVINAVSTTADNALTTDVVEGSITFGGTGDTVHKANNSSLAGINGNRKISNNMTIYVDARKIYDPAYDPESAEPAVQANPPGVYRYKISDVTTAETLTAAGVTDGGAANEIYLDVYTKYNSDRNGLVIYGYVLFKSSGEADSITYSSTVTNTTESKVTGFDVVSETETVTVDGQNKIDLNSDRYYTYNVKVKKVVTGDLADTQHNFPFKVELNNSSITSSDDFIYKIKKNGMEGDSIAANLAVDGSWTLDGIADAETGLQLRHNDEITIIGLPADTTIKVTEKNDTGDIYIASAKDNNSTALQLKVGEADAADSAVISPDEQAAMNAAYSIDGTKTITFTNNMKDISVTGLLFSIAPFIIITAAGAGLILLVIRSRKQKNGENEVI